MEVLIEYLPIQHRLVDYVQMELPPQYLHELVHLHGVVSECDDEVMQVVVLQKKLMDDGVIGQAGVLVAQHVDDEHKVEAELVRIQVLKMEAEVVYEFHQSLVVAIPILVILTPGKHEHGGLVMLVVDDELKLEQLPVEEAMESQ